MFAQTFRFDSTRFRQAFAARKPRHPLARLALGLLGLGVLVLLVFFSVFLGAAMIIAGVAYRLLRMRGQPIARTASGHATAGNVVDAEYRVIARPGLPSGR